MVIMKELKCADCGDPAEYVDFDAYNEVVCESCIKQRLLDRAYNNRAIGMLESLPAEDMEQVIKNNS